MRRVGRVVGFSGFKVSRVFSLRLGRFFGGGYRYGILRSSIGRVVLEGVVVILGEELSVWRGGRGLVGW